MAGGEGGRRLQAEMLLQLRLPLPPPLLPLLPLLQQLLGEEGGERH